MDENQPQQQQQQQQLQLLDIPTIDRSSPDGQEFEQLMLLPPYNQVHIGHHKGLIFTTEGSASLVLIGPSR